MMKSVRSLFLLVMILTMVSACGTEETQTCALAQGCGDSPAVAPKATPVPTPSFTYNPTPTPTPTPATTATSGFARAGEIGYFTNDVKEYCSFASYDQWINAGGPADVLEAPVISLEGLTDKGVCAYRGFFAVGAEGYFANEVGSYCRLINYSHWAASGGPTDPARIPNFTFVPDSMKNEGDCVVRGLFFVGGSGYYANEAGKYCHLRDWDAYLRAGGNADLSNASTLESFPATMVPDGECE